MGIYIVHLKGINIMWLLSGIEDLKMQRCLAAIKPETKRILEVGCGVGTYIHSIKKNNPSIEAYGCDINELTIRQSFNENNTVKYWVCDALFLPYKDETFDMIVMIDVLEHMLDVKTFMDEVQRVLKKAGKLYCNIPCEGEPFTFHWFLWRLKLPGYKLKEKICGHIQRFTFKQVIHLMKQNGFKIDSVEYMYHPIGQIMDILNYILIYIRNSAFNRLPPDIKQGIATLYKLYKHKQNSSSQHCFGFKEIKNRCAKLPSFFDRFLMFLSTVNNSAFNCATNFN